MLAIAAIARLIIVRVIVRVKLAAIAVIMRRKNTRLACVVLFQNRSTSIVTVAESIELTSEPVEVFINSAIVRKKFVQVITKMSCYKLTNCRVCCSLVIAKKSTYSSLIEKAS